MIEGDTQSPTLPSLLLQSFQKEAPPQGRGKNFGRGDQERESCVDRAPNQARDSPETRWSCESSSNAR